MRNVQLVYFANAQDWGRKLKAVSTFKLQQISLFLK